jgi:hypothetical protein
MLNAEHIALESRLVQQMVAIRQREMDGLLARYSAIGTQASLLAGFAITSLTALNPSDRSVMRSMTYIFYISSLACVFSCMHVIMCTMFVCNWAPSLALRGPTGSLARAYEASKSQKFQINMSFTVSVFFFSVQTVAAIWVMDEHKGVTPIAVFAAISGFAVLIFDIIVHKRIHERFFKGVDMGRRGGRRLPSYRKKSSQAQGNAQPLIASNGGRSDDGAGACGVAPEDPRRRMSILDNPLAGVGAHPDAVDRRPELKAQSDTEFNMAGSLLKRSAGHSDVGGRTLRRVASTVTSSVTGEWRERFFVLRNGQLQYWRTEAEYDADKPPALDNPILLRGMEVLVDTSDARWGFTLQPTDPTEGRRSWHFRAADEATRLQWARRLVLNTLTAGQ